jgi:hypothetical protein
MNAHATAIGCTSLPISTEALAVDTGRMDSILIYCRPRANGRGHTLRAWLEHRAAELAARPGVQRTAVVHLGTPDPSSRRDLGWLLECELDNAGEAHANTLRALLTDMRLVGLEPVVFMREPQRA